MLVVDPADRLSAVDILGHPWVTVSIRHNTSVCSDEGTLKDLWKSIHLILCIRSCFVFSVKAETVKDEELSVGENIRHFSRRDKPSRSRAGIRLVAVRTLITPVTCVQHLAILNCTQLVVVTPLLYHLQSTPLDHPSRYFQGRRAGLTVPSKQQTSTEGEDEDEIF